jgi:hypothetical protein
VLHRACPFFARTIAWLDEVEVQGGAVAVPKPAASHMLVHAQRQCCQALEEAEQEGKHMDLAQWLQTHNPGQGVCINYYQGFYQLPNLFGQLKGSTSVDYSEFFMSAHDLDPFRAAFQPAWAVRKQVRSLGGVQIGRRNEEEH